MIKWGAGLTIFVAAIAAIWWCWPASEPYRFAPARLTLGEDVKPQSFQTGPHLVALSTEGGARLTITGPDGVLFDSGPGRAFIVAAQGAVRYGAHHGMYQMRDTVERACTDQVLGQPRVRGEDIVITTTLVCPDGLIDATLTLDPSPADPHALLFSLALSAEAQARGYNRIGVSAASTAQEHVFGLGTQFSKFNLKGETVPVIVSEQGIGRGREPLTRLINLVVPGAGGLWHTTYAPSPGFVTNQGRMLFIQSYEPLLFDFRTATAITTLSLSPMLKGSFTKRATPQAAVESLTAQSGRMQRPPAWSQQGAIVGLQGGTEIVRPIVDKALKDGVPVKGVWLQDWQGQRITSNGKRLWWNWVLDDDRYPDWHNMVSDWRARGIRTLVYINPFLVDVAADLPGRRNLYAEARDQGLLITTEAGTPYLIDSGEIRAGLVDLSNPKARDFMVGVIKDELIASGARGWMADFAESLPLDGVMQNPDGLTAEALHNRYPELWAQVNRRALRESGLEDEALVFHRSAYGRSPGLARAFWLGDQLPSWDGHDGIKTVVIGLLSSGVSGFAFNHADLGGYTAIQKYIVDIHRTPELHKRWAELSAFTPLFRTHEGTLPDANHQFHDAPETTAHFAQMATLFACLAPYRDRLAAEAEAYGLPLIRPVWFLDPANEELLALEHRQFMLGNALSVAPVLDEGVTEAEIILPKGQWVHVLTGDRLDGGRHTVKAPIGTPAAFMRANHASLPRILDCLARN